MQLGYEFCDFRLLKSACTHPSFLNETPLVEMGNQRLEFLGDAVLGCVIAEYLYNASPQMNEGQMTRLRARIIDKRACSRFANSLQISQFLRFGRGKHSLTTAIMADFFEALIGAIFCDGGFDRAREFILRVCRAALEGALENADLVDFKSKLQILAQQHLRKTPVYSQISQSGPSHLALIRVVVEVGSQVWGEGAANSKKSAEQRAACQALTKLQDQIAELRGAMRS